MKELYKTISQSCTEESQSNTEGKQSVILSSGVNINSGISSEIILLSLLNITSMSNQLTREVIGAAMEVHSALEPGLLESAYQSCLYYELRNRGYFVEVEKSLPVKYKEHEIEQGYRIDLVVNNEVVIEIKTVDELNDVHLAQILTYIKFGGYNKGLLINFHVKSLRNGIRRVVL